MPQPEFLLASASPRRRQLFGLLNIPFSVVDTDIDESPQVGELAPDLVTRLSRLKAQAAHTLSRDSYVVAADTDVEFDGSILGKPRDRQDARDMLRSLRGREHLVYGGITLITPSGRDSGDAKNAVVTVLTKTRVWMRDYTDAEIDTYVATGDPLDKAAGYAVQHRHFRPVANFEGCFANVMGLALCRLWNVISDSLPLSEPNVDCHLHPGSDCTVERLVEQGEISGS